MKKTVLDQQKLHGYRYRDEKVLISHMHSLLDTIFIDHQENRNIFKNLSKLCVKLKIISVLIRGKKQKKLTEFQKKVRH